MLIFQDANGSPIKFFIQKDLPKEIYTEVCETITSLGGRVETKVPRAGYIIVQPGSLEEERLKICWASPDRPERFFVPYTFVDACKINGSLLKQIFVRDGHPIRMHIDSSIANVNVRAALSQRIMHSGGDPLASAQNAQVILADPNTEIFQKLVKTYQSQPDKYIESYLWVKQCVEQGQVSYTPVVYKNPGGRRAGEERTQFTEEDEMHLCNWIAMKIPFKETGGRTGNRLYQQLLEMAGNPDYPWVTRHTWQSWRERYKKNAARLDPKIAEIVERNKPAVGEKGQYGYVRKPDFKPKKSKKKSADGEENAAAGPPKEELEFMSQTLSFPPLGVPMAGVVESDPSAPLSFPLSTATPPPLTSNVVPQPVPSVPISAEVLAARQNASEEEDDEEWQIREGNGPPPAWAKRKASAEEEEEGQGPHKRLRASSKSPTTGNASAGSSTSAPHVNSAGRLHVFDQAILDIASQYRFTVDEVKEYYDRCGDLNRTTRRFARLREIIMSIPDEENTLTGAASAPSTSTLANAIDDNSRGEGLSEEARILQSIIGV
ncbi:hypothetical protein BDW22DRAFT_1350886 [Trametopsis cervina]|nr:hypothetical protein BDW22DRAFT_1350886 [Trametopsis cervina]